MKKFILFVFITNLLHAGTFQRRFGSNSHAYNIPLYFGKGRCRRISNTPVRHYREAIRNKMKNKRQKKLS